jgi:hypothetical protein
LCSRSRSSIRKIYPLSSSPNNFTASQLTSCQPSYQVHYHTTSLIMPANISSTYATNGSVKRYGSSLLPWSWPCKMCVILRSCPESCLCLRSSSSPYHNSSYGPKPSGFESTHNSSLQPLIVTESNSCSYSIDRFNNDLTKSYPAYQYTSSDDSVAAHTTQVQSVIDKFDAVYKK